MALETTARIVARFRWTPRLIIHDKFAWALAARPRAVPPWTAKELPLSRGLPHVEHHALAYVSTV
jgi:hypothetical protein